MKFIVVGINHKTHKLDERHSYSFQDSDKLSFSTYLLQLGIKQCVILSTCNRSEVYVVSDDCFDEKYLSELYVQYFHQENDRILLKTNEEAFKHLLSVTCGIESMVLGEDQIIHQVKDAYRRAFDLGFCQKEINFIFQKVLQFSKKMHSSYSLSEHPLSLSYIAYKQIKDHLKEDDKIMICGMGEMAKLMVEYLKDYHLYLVNRDFKKVEPYLNEKNVFIPFEKRKDYLEDIDLLISATASPHLIFNAEDFKKSPRIMVDLALPRDIDEKVRNTLLIDMNFLQEVCENEKELRKGVAIKIEEECILEAQKLFKAFLDLKKDYQIQEVSLQYENCFKETVHLLKEKLDLNSKEEHILEKVLHASFFRLMQKPIQLISSNMEYEERIKELLREINENHNR